MVLFGGWPDTDFFRVATQTERHTRQSPSIPFMVQAAYPRGVYTTAKDHPQKVDSGRLGGVWSPSLELDVARCIVMSMVTRLGEAAKPDADVLYPELDEPVYLAVRAVHDERKLSRAFGDAKSPLRAAADLYSSVQGLVGKKKNYAPNDQLRQWFDKWNIVVEAVTKAEVFFGGDWMELEYIPTTSSYMRLKRDNDSDRVEDLVEASIENTQFDFEAALLLSLLSKRLREDIANACNNFEPIAINQRPRWTEDAPKDIVIAVSRPLFAPTDREKAAVVGVRLREWAATLSLNNQVGYGDIQKFFGPASSNAYGTWTGRSPPLSQVEPLRKEAEQALCRLFYIVVRSMAKYSDVNPCEILFWVFSSPSLDERQQRICMPYSNLSRTINTKTINTGFFTRGHTIITTMDTAYPTTLPVVRVPAPQGVVQETVVRVMETAEKVKEKLVAAIDMAARPFRNSPGPAPTTLTRTTEPGPYMITRKTVPWASWLHTLSTELRGELLLDVCAVAVVPYFASVDEAARPGNSNTFLGLVSGRCFSLHAANAYSAIYTLLAGETFAKTLEQLENKPDAAKMATDGKFHKEEYGGWRREQEARSERHAKVVQAMLSCFQSAQMEWEDYFHDQEEGTAVEKLEKALRECGAAWGKDATTEICRRFDISYLSPPLLPESDMKSGAGKTFRQWSASNTIHVRRLIDDFFNARPYRIGEKLLLDLATSIANGKKLWGAVYSVLLDRPALTVFAAPPRKSRDDSIMIVDGDERPRDGDDGARGSKTVVMGTNPEGEEPPAAPVATRYGMSSNGGSLQNGWAAYSSATLASTTTSPNAFNAPSHDNQQGYRANYGYDKRVTRPYWADAVDEKEQNSAVGAKFEEFSIKPPTTRNSEEEELYIDDLAWFDFLVQVASGVAPDDSRSPTPQLAVNDVYDMAYYLWCRSIHDGWQRNTSDEAHRFRLLFLRERCAFPVAWVIERYRATGRPVRKWLRSSSHRAVLARDVTRVHGNIKWVSQKRVRVANLVIVDARNGRRMMEILETRPATECTLQRTTIVYSYEVGKNERDAMNMKIDEFHTLLRATWMRTVILCACQKRDWASVFLHVSAAEGTIGLKEGLIFRARDVDYSFAPVLAVLVLARFAPLAILKQGYSSALEAQCEVLTMTQFASTWLAKLMQNQTFTDEEQ
jgi:hypothetical protein